MALKGGFKNFANQTREIKEAPPIDLDVDVPALHIIHEAAALHGASASQPTTPMAAPVPVTGLALGETDGGAGPVTASKPEEAREKPAAPEAGSEASKPVVSSHTHYTELVRKELRLHADQADELTVLASKVQRARKEKGERITDNTLIRVAVDLLLQRQKELVGSTEDELRIALGLAPRA
jgi:hypothetical protein